MLQPNVRLRPREFIESKRGIEPKNESSPTCIDLAYAELNERSRLITRVTVRPVVVSCRVVSCTTTYELHYIDPSGEESTFKKIPRNFTRHPVNKLVCVRLVRLVFYNPHWFISFKPVTNQATVTLRHLETRISRNWVNRMKYYRMLRSIKLPSSTGGKKKKRKIIRARNLLYVCVCVYICICTCI